MYKEGLIEKVMGQGEKTYSMEEKLLEYKEGLGLASEEGATKVISSSYKELEKKAWHHLSR